MCCVDFLKIWLVSSNLSRTFLTLHSSLISSPRLVLSTTCLLFSLPNRGLATTLPPKGTSATCIFSTYPRLPVSNPFSGTGLMSHLICRPGPSPKDNSPCPLPPHTSSTCASVFAFSWLLGCCSSLLLSVCALLVAIVVFSFRGLVHFLCFFFEVSFSFYWFSVHVGWAKSVLFCAHHWSPVLTP